jgi:hypothetical protein
MSRGNLRATHVSVEKGREDWALTVPIADDDVRARGAGSSWIGRSSVCGDVRVGLGSWMAPSRSAPRLAGNLEFGVPPSERDQAKRIRVDAQTIMRSSSVRDLGQFAGRRRRSNRARIDPDI